MLGDGLPLNLCRNREQQMGVAEMQPRLQNCEKRECRNLNKIRTIKLLLNDLWSGKTSIMGNGRMVHSTKILSINLALQHRIQSISETTRQLLRYRNRHLRILFEVGNKVPARQYQTL